MLTLILLDDLQCPGVDLLSLSLVEEEAGLGLASTEARLDHLLHHLGLGSSHPLTESGYQSGLNVVANIDAHLHTRTARFLVRKCHKEKKKKKKSYYLIEEGDWANGEAEALELLVELLDFMTLLQETSSLNHEG